MRVVCSVKDESGLKCSLIRKIGTDSVSCMSGGTLSFGADMNLLQLSEERLTRGKTSCVIILYNGYNIRDLTAGKWVGVYVCHRENDLIGPD